MNVEDNVRKTAVALFSCKKAIGHRLGPSPKNTKLTVTRPILLYEIIVWWMTLGKSRIRNRFRKVRGRSQNHTLWCFEYSFLFASPKQNVGNTVARLVATNQCRDLGVGHSAMNHILIGYIELEFQKPTPNGKCFFIFRKTIYLVGKTAYGFLLMAQSQALKLALAFTVRSQK